MTWRGICTISILKFQYHHLQISERIAGGWRPGTVGIGHSENAAIRDTDSPPRQLNGWN
jgi:hypothetical protein